MDQIKSNILLQHLSVYYSLKDEKSIKGKEMEWYLYSNNSYDKKSQETKALKEIEECFKKERQI